MAEAHGWQLIQDTSWPGYEAVPTWIIQGYTTMAREAADQLAQAGHPRPTHVFLQAGVGAMAGGVLGCLAARYGDQAPVFVSVEPEDIPCIYRSALAGDGQPHTVAGEAGTIMAGLNCGTPCSLTWPVLRDGVTWYFACPDAVAEAGMRRLGRPLPGDQAVVSGESGAVTAGLLDMEINSGRLIIGPAGWQSFQEMFVSTKNVSAVLGETKDLQHEKYSQAYI